MASSGHSAVLLFSRRPTEAFISRSQPSFIQQSTTWWLSLKSVSLTSCHFAMLCTSIIFRFCCLHYAMRSESGMNCLPLFDRLSFSFCIQTFIITDFLGFLVVLFYFLSAHWQITIIRVVYIYYVVLQGVYWFTLWSAEVCVSVCNRRKLQLIL